MDRESVRRSKIEPDAVTGMSRFSLIMATFGRTREIENFFRSLEAQVYPQYELLLVDQNEPGFLKEILDVWSERLNIIYLRSEQGASKGRNVGLAHATGSVIAFPDDDSWYSEGLLTAIDRFFAEHGEFDFVSVGVTDENSVSSGNRWFQNQCTIAPLNIFRTSVTYAYFQRRTALTMKVRFDESLGPSSGTGFDCGDDTDYVLAVMETGSRGFFTRSLLVHHPRRDMLSGTVSDERALRYGAAMGCVCKRRSIHGVWFLLVCYDALRCFIVFARGKLAAARQCWMHLAGLVWGYLHG
jgi:glycosyltransferase involved in cell wall biosynthesis